MRWRERQKTKQEKANRKHMFICEQLTTTRRKLFLKISQSSDGRSDGGGGHGSVDVGSSGDDLVALGAVPDSGGLSLHGLLSAERAGVAGVLGDLELLGHLTEGSSITGSVLSDDSDLLRSLGHCDWITWKSQTRKIHGKQCRKRREEGRRHKMNKHSRRKIFCFLKH